MVRFRRRQLGTAAERLAFEFLTQRGLRPVAHNFRTRRGEIDLVMLDGDCVAFVEVRYRRASSLVGAALTVDARKQNKLLHTAALFLAQHPEFRHAACRFDVVGIDQDDGGAKTVNWLRDAFRPET